jgi:hypothetical protein
MKPFRRNRSSLLCRALALSSALFGASTALAQSAPSAGDISKYDRNGNGRLDPDEAAAMRAAEPSSSGSGDIVALSPFEVRADDDHGYLASSTMSGTRLNSKIEDLGAAITVITKQQLEDTAAVDINDIFTYEANTEGTNQFTASSVNVNGLTTDSVQQSPQTANRVRGIGAANLSVGGFEANPRIPVDSYNLDSVEIVRGANSNLAGLGDASGTVNLNQSQGNLSRPSTELTMRGDSWGGYRATVNLNRPVIQNKLAVRVAALYDSKGFIRKPSGDLQRRQYIATTYRPFLNTTIHGSAEFITDKRQTPNAQTPRDTISYWLQNGRPTWDPITQTVHYPDGRSIAVGTTDALLPSGLGLDTTQYTRPSMYIDNSQIVLWTPNRNSTTGIPSNVGGAARIIGTYTDVIRSRSTLYPLFTPTSVSDRSIYDWDSINFAATNWNSDKAAVYNASIDQIFFHTPEQQLTGNAAWRHEYATTYDHNVIRETSFLYLDINERLLDGRPNPFFLRPYVTVWEPTAGRTSDNVDAYRAQLAYELDLRRKSRWLSWLGRERVLGFYESRFATTRGYNTREGTLDAHPWTSQTAGFINSATGRTSFKYYLGDNKGYNVDYAPPKTGTQTGMYPFHYLSNPATGAFTDEMALFGESPISASRVRSDRHTRGVNLQSFLFGDRLVGTVGLRHDEIRRRNSPSLRVQPDGYYHFEDLETNGYNAWAYAQGDTKTYQAVLRPFRGWKGLDRRLNGSGAPRLFGELLRGLNLTYNISHSFQPDTGTPKKNLLGVALDDPKGYNREYGFLLDMFDSKLSARVLWFKTEQKNARVTGGASTAVGRTQQLDTGTSAFALYNWAQTVVMARPAMANATEDQIVEETYKLMQLPNRYFDQFSGYQLSDVNDVSSTGQEWEVNFNPNRSLRLKFTGAHRRTTDSNLSNANQEYIDMRLPAWTTIKDDAGNLWWTTTTATNWYNNNIVPVLKLARANLGKPRTQDKAWTWALLATYTFGYDNLFGSFGDNYLRKLRGLSVGTSVRWASKSSIGFYGLVDSDGIMRTYDINRPIYDPARTSYDLIVSYPFRFWRDKVRGRVQLNGRDIFSHRGSLRAVGTNPDGSPANFRIIDGPQWLLTTTFDL